MEASSATSSSSSTLPNVFRVDDNLSVLAVDGVNGRVHDVDSAMMADDGNLTLEEESLAFGEKAEMEQSRQSSRDLPRAVLHEVKSAVICDPVEGHDDEFDVELTFDNVDSTEDDADNAMVFVPSTTGEAERDQQHHHQGSAEDGSVYNRWLKGVSRSFKKILRQCGGGRSTHEHMNSAAQSRLHQVGESTIISTLTDDESGDDSCDGSVITVNPITSVAPPPLPSSTSGKLSMSGASGWKHEPMVDHGAIQRTANTLHQRLLLDMVYTPLLGEPLPEHREKMCLLLDLDETLVHSSFQMVEGADLVMPVHLGGGTYQPIYVCKRPGVDQFLQIVCELFEVVIFTASLANYADPVIDFLDSKKRITARLYRDSCLQLQGLYIKDMSRLGRHMDRVLLVDNAPTSFSLQPENAILCRSWFSDPHDDELVNRLVPLLKHLSYSRSVAEWRAQHRASIDTRY